ILDRQQFSSADGLYRGAYILAETAKKRAEIILIASGAEVSLIVAAKEKLEKKQIAVRIVSMPSWELFAAQPKKYRDTVFPSSIPLRLAVEAGVSQGFERFVGEHGDIISIEHFGASAPGSTVLEKHGFTLDTVYQRALALLRCIR